MEYNSSNVTWEDIGEIGTGSRRHGYNGWFVGIIRITGIVDSLSVRLNNIYNNVGGYRKMYV